MTFYNFLLAILWNINTFTLTLLIAILWLELTKEETKNDREGTGLFVFWILECLAVYAWYFYSYPPLNILIYLIVSGIAGIVFAHKLFGWRFNKIKFK